ncbi:MAG: hypothetical protein Q8R37_04660 [Nanoarchaeota archaeon]|nr:hypothetical protein [Nanoarchaeota archaeon]
MKENKLLLIRDSALVAISIIIALILAKNNVFVKILVSAQGLKFIGSFIAGMFFTTVFTTAPAVVTLGEIAQISSLWSTAFFGALGATLVDVIIFRIVRDRFSEHFLELIAQKRKIRLKILAKLKLLKWLTLVIGCVIFASPLPDELAISILGFSHLRSYQFILFSFISKFIGIMIIGIVARALI